VIVHLARRTACNEKACNLCAFPYLKHPAVHVEIIWGKFVRFELVLMIVLSVLVLALPALANDVDRYNQNLKNENSSIRVESAMAVGELNDPSSVEPLIQALKDNNSDVRSESAKALGWLKEWSR